MSLTAAVVLAVLVGEGTTVGKGDRLQCSCGSMAGWRKTVVTGGAVGRGEAKAGGVLRLGHQEVLFSELPSVSHLYFLLVPLPQAMRQ